MFAHSTFVVVGAIRVNHFFLYINKLTIFYLSVSVVCPSGYEPRSLPGGVPCAPCRFGYWRKGDGGPNDFCEQCRNDMWTLTTGIAKSKLCICKLYVLNIFERRITIIARD